MVRGQLKALGLQMTWLIFFLLSSTELTGLFIKLYCIIDAQRSFPTFTVYSTPLQCSPASSWTQSHTFYGMILAVKHLKCVCFYNQHSSWLGEIVVTECVIILRLLCCWFQINCLLFNNDINICVRENSFGCKNCACAHGKIGFP